MTLMPVYSNMLYLNKSKLETCDWKCGPARKNKRLVLTLFCHSPAMGGLA